jgi:hypothetical protein
MIEPTTEARCAGVFAKETFLAWLNAPIAGVLLCVVVVPDGIAELVYFVMVIVFLLEDQEDSLWT